MSKRRRISDDELAFYEDNIANAVGIENSVKRAVYEVQEPSVMVELASILGHALGIRKRNQERMNERKDNGGE